MKCFLLTLIALALVWVGLCCLVLVPFLPLVYLDVPAPSWIGPPFIFVMGIALTALGVWLWIFAWKPKAKK